MTLRGIHLWGSVGVLGAILLVSTSSTLNSDSMYQAKTIGERLPEVKITNAQTTRDGIHSSDSEYTLVHFWAAYDAESRHKNVVYTRYAEMQSTERFNYRAISLDVDADVYTETIAFDGVSAGNTQHLVDAERRTQVMELCGQTTALCSYLVNKEGVILAVNPTNEELDKFVAQ